MSYELEVREAAGRPLVWKPRRCRSAGHL